MKIFLLNFLFICTTLCGEQLLNDFDGLMGKSTPHWDHIAKAEDLQTCAFAKALYDKNKEKQFVNQGFYKIPPTIHFIWLGPHPFPPESVENVRSWIAMNPGWKVKFWTDRKREPPCEGMEMVLVDRFSFSRLKQCYAQSENWGEKSDLLRYEILFQEGGVYVDHDANCLKPFNGMHQGYDFFTCLETPHDPLVGRSVTCGNGVIGSRAQHPTLAKAMDLIVDRWSPLAEKFKGRDPYSRSEIVMQRTYIALTDALEGTLEVGNNVDIVLPAAYFFSKGGIPSIYSQHFYAGAWDEFKIKNTPADLKQNKALNEMRLQGRNLFRLLYGLIGFNVLLLSIVYIRRRRANA